MEKTKNGKMALGIFFAILAAAFYALNTPFSKLILPYMPVTIMAGLLYLGAGICMGILSVCKKIVRKNVIEEKLTKKEIPLVVLMCSLDVLAPIFLLIGINSTTAANASLLNNFEIVITAVIALLIFKEAISPRLWVGIGFVTASCLLLSFEDMSSFKFSSGSLFVLLAAVCWGFENNVTRKLSIKDPLQVVFVNGIVSGTGSILIGIIIGEKITYWWAVLATIGVGLIAYGLSVYFYLYAQRYLGAARTSAFYAIAPFVGVGVSFILFPSVPTYVYFIALLLMLIGAWLCSSDKSLFKK